MDSETREVVIIDGARTPIGRFGGAFKDLNAPTLAEIVMKEAIGRCGIEAGMLEEVIFGQVFQGSDAPNLARFCALRVGIPPHVPGLTVNRQCASGLQAIVSAVEDIMVGEKDLVLTGGVESMSTVPFVLRGARWGFRLGPQFLHDGMAELANDVTAAGMWIWAEKTGEKYGISRQAQDEFALLSHQRAVAAIKDGRFKEEIAPVEVPSARGQPQVIEDDEGPREDTSLEALARLTPRFKWDGMVTAGNASPLSDGASALLIASREMADMLGLTPSVRVVSWAVAGVAPDDTGMGSVPAMHRALESAGLTLEDIGLFEINEAFASQYLAVEKALQLNREKVNVNGGAIALGHPVGCSGNRLTLTLIKEMHRRSVEFGVVSLCAAGGMGIAFVVQAV